MKKLDVYEIVTNRIIENLENGIVPWQKPFVNGCNTPINWKTQTVYRGINLLLLQPGEYATFKQITEAGGKVKKGEKGHIVVFWNFLDKVDENDELKKIPFLKYYTVFEINTQCEGLTSKRKIIEYPENQVIENAENLVNNFENKPRITIESKGTAAYYPTRDCIIVPPISDFISSEAYYATLFHELVHSTGSAKRLNREGVANFDRFGSEKYSKEELVAEIGASFLNSIVGIDNEKIFKNTTAYLQSWLSALKDDKRLIVQAAAQAQKAVDYIQNITNEKAEVA